MQPLQPCKRWVKSREQLATKLSRDEKAATAKHLLSFIMEKWKHTPVAQWISACPFVTTSWTEECKIMQTDGIHIGKVCVQNHVQRCMEVVLMFGYVRGPYVQHKMADGIGSIAWNVKTSPVLVPANVNDHFSKVLELDRGSPMPIKGHCARSFSAHKKWTAWHWQESLWYDPTIAGQASSKIIMFWLSRWLFWQVLNIEPEQLQIAWLDMLLLKPLNQKSK